MRKAFVLLALAACNSGTSPAAGDGIKVDSAGAVSVDAAKVPVVPTCGAGLSVRRTADGSGWECKAVGFSELSGVSATTEWPGTADWSRITNAPGTTNVQGVPGGTPVAVTISGTPAVALSGSASVQGTGSAGTPSGGVLTVQGAPGASPVAVSGTVGIAAPAKLFSYHAQTGLGGRFSLAAPSATDAFYISSLTTATFTTGTFPIFVDYGYGDPGNCNNMQTVFRCMVVAPAGTCTSTFPTPLRIPANKALCADHSGSSADVTAVGYLAP